ncbi:sanguinarine reductase isoform X1 [Diospyros lotus]|uniref:sanguinarine reductase isoform X1 n=1 Tax=Diospyros lotus TaxID=55363 RepID=UPI0022510857|nr:sanguinarine reductase isoform X1 [Diospyros lotus]
MATKLAFFAPLSDLLPIATDKFPKSRRIVIPKFPHLLPNGGPGYDRCSNTSILSFGGGVAGASSPSHSSLICHANAPPKELDIRSTERSESIHPSSKLVLVVGGSGGVGQLVVASLLSRNIKSRLLLRDPEKAITLFGKQDEEKLQVWKGDTRNPEDLHPSMFEGVTHVICCTGTTAFPSRRWNGDNTPERVDWEGVRNLVSVLPSSVKRIVLVSSVGVTKFNELPWSIMNLFGVLKYKKMGEDVVCSSGFPFTIIRAGRLTDGPYTSYDLNTLLKATAGERRAVLVAQGDTLVGEVSRLVVAEACIQALDIECTQGQIYEINSVKGEGPESDPLKWQELFKAAQRQN